MPGESSGTEEPGGLQSMGRKESDMTERLSKAQRVFLGFPGSSDGNESACTMGDPGSIPRSRRSPGEGNDYPHQYSYLENSMDSPWDHRVRED